jgi:hypothetical protein
VTTTDKKVKGIQMMRMARVWATTSKEFGVSRAQTGRAWETEVFVEDNNNGLSQCRLKSEEADGTRKIAM